MSDVEEFLSHYGKKGMKWGVRNRSVKQEERRAKQFKQYSEDAKTATNIRKAAKESPVKVKTLSNKEIEVFLTRASLERRFNEATPGPGKKAVNTVKNLLGLGKTMNEAIAFANSPAGQMISEGMKRDRSQAA